MIRRLQRIIKHVRIHQTPLQGLHERITLILSNRPLTRLISIRDRHVPTTHLSRITLNSILQLLPIVLRKPVLNLVQQSKSTTITLSGPERTRLHLNARSIITTTHDLQPHINTVLPAKPIPHQDMEHIKRVRSLLLLQRKNLHQSIRAPLPHRRPIRPPMREHRRPKRLHKTQNSEQRVLPPALDALQRPAAPINEPPLLINRIPPQNDAQLLQGEPENLLPLTKRLQEIAAPPSNPPPQRPLRQHKAPVSAALPRRTIMHRSITNKQLLVRQLIIRHVPKRERPRNPIVHEGTPNPQNSPGRGTRTRTPQRHRILSAACLPVPPHQEENHANPPHQGRAA